MMKHSLFHQLLRLPLLFFVWLQFEENHGDFSKEHIAVWLDPWVSRTDAYFGELHEYSERELGAMVAKISTKFKRILMRSVSIEDTSSRAYLTLKRIPNVTANFNKNSGRPPLELVMQFKLDLSQKPNSSTTSFDVVKGLADGANSIFPNTVRTLMLDHDDLQLNSATVDDTREMLVHARNVIQNETLSHFQYNLSVDLDYNHCLHPNSHVPSYMIPILRIVDEAKFFVKTSNVKMAGDAKDIQLVFNASTRWFDLCKAKIGTVVPGLQVAFMTRWTDTVADAQNIVKLVLFWRRLDTFARDRNTRFVLQEAFDNPAEERSTNGWWRLVENDNYESAVDYVYESKEDVIMSYTTRRGFPGGFSPTDSQTTESLLRSYTTRGFPDGFSPTESHKTESLIPLEISDSSAGSDSTGNILITVLSSVGAGILLILAVLGTAAYFIYKRLIRRIGQQRGKLLTDDEIQAFRNGNGGTLFLNSHPTTQPITDNGYATRLEIARDSFQIVHQLILGAGEFGVVFRGKIKTANGEEREVAVKTTKPCGSANALKGLLSEIKVMSYIGKNANVVSLLGANTAKLHRGKVYLFTELCQLGSLEKHLRSISRSDLIYTVNQEPRRLTLGDANYVNGLVTECRLLNSELQKWAYEIACGMEYLASKQVVHADLATRNVLLTEHKTAKISDFGLSRRLYEYACYVKRGVEPLPWKWMSPESLARSEFSEKSDVWAYGVTLWDIFSLGGSPYAGLKITLLEWTSTLSQGFRLGKPSCDWNNRYDIMTKCWKILPEERPSFTDLKSILEMSVPSDIGDLLYIDLSA